MATPPSYFLIPFLTPPKTHGFPGISWVFHPWDGHSLGVSSLEWIALWFPWHLLGVSSLRWPFPGCFILGMDRVAPLDFQLGGHQQSGFHLTLQNPSLPGIIIPPGAQSNRHAKASSSSTAWPEETQVETPTVRITPLHRIIQDSSGRGSSLERHGGQNVMIEGPEIRIEK